jgi:CheY-like chemotaxis protein
MMKEQKRILIIDDDADVLEILRDILQNEGYVVETAKTGKVALEKAQNSLFDVALIDINLPDMLGMDVLKNLKNKYPSMKDIIITGNATLQNTIDAVNLGASAYILKPIDVEKITATIKALLTNIQLPASFRKPQIMKLLKAIKVGKVNKFVPSFSYEKGLIYPDLEKFDPTFALDYHVFEEIEKYGVLSRELYDSGLACPSCGSLKVSIKINCSSCGSMNIEKGEAVEHLHCGHIDKVGEFVKGEKMICPKCKRELKTLGVDYRKKGLFFKCGKCGIVMPSPTYVYTCGGCGESSNADRLDIKKFFTFVVDVKGKDLLDAWVTNFDDLIK